MTWGGSISSIDSQACVVSITFTEDQSGAVLNETLPIPASPVPTWLSDYVASRIVALTLQAAVVQNIQTGYVTPTQSILSIADVVASAAPVQVSPVQPAPVIPATQ